MEQTCSCGCDEPTKGGRYLPGHDQRLRSAIEKAAGGLESLRTIVEGHIGRQISTRSEEAPASGHAN